MNKKNLTEQDKKDWKEFLDSSSQLPDKELFDKKKNNFSKKFKFDFHGYSISDANKKVHEIIKTCHEKGVSEILIITGKGIHSKSKDNVYVSNELNKLQNTIPEFIKNNSELNSKISYIKEADKASGGSGAIIIKIKN